MNAKATTHLTIDQYDKITYALSNVSALANMLQAAASSDVDLNQVTLARVGQLIERETETIQGNLKSEVGA